jgi:hypothetical protein
MSERRRIWPLLIYGGLAAIAAVRRKETVRTPEKETYGAVRRPYRTVYPALDDANETAKESPPAPNVDADKRPQEQV